MLTLFRGTGDENSLAEAYFLVHSGRQLSKVPMGESNPRSLQLDNHESVPLSISCTRSPTRSLGNGPGKLYGG